MPWIILIAGCVGALVSTACGVTPVVGLIVTGVAIATWSELGKRAR